MRPRSLLTTAAVLLLLAAGAGVAAGEPFVPVTDDATSPALTDGTRFVAYMHDGRTVHAFDGRFGVESDVAAPASCADPIELEDVGGGQALVNCADKGTWHEEGEPLLLDLTTGVWHEPPGAATVLRRMRGDTDNAAFKQVGAHWIGGWARDADQPLWLEWHTGEFRDGEGDRHEAPDLGAPDLFVPLCRSLTRPFTGSYRYGSGDGPTFEPLLYAPPLAYVGLTLRRCGSSRRVSLAVNTDSMQLADGIATWYNGKAVRAYVPYCGVRFTQRLGQDPSRVGHTDSWVYASVLRDGDRYRILRAPQPWCPDLAGPRAVRVGSARHSRVAELRSWRPAASDWSMKRLPLVVHHARTLDLRPGAAAIVEVACQARSVRWRIAAERWRDVHLTRGKWRFRAPSQLPIGRLSLDVRCASGERGTFVLPVRQR